MLLTKGEKSIGLVEEGYAALFISELDARLGKPFIRPTSLASGYVRKGYEYISLYNGRFGVGITVRRRNIDSTRYCWKDTYIFPATVEEVEEVIESIKRRAGLVRYN